MPGRDPGCDIRLHGSGISSQHAALVHHSDGRLYVIDLKSVSSGWVVYELSCMCTSCAEGGPVYV